MRELESLFAEHETAIVIGFDHLNHHVQCYAHIINICSSHIIASMTPTRKSNIFDADDSKDDDFDPNHVIEELKLSDCYNDIDEHRFKSWLAGIKHNPLRRARRVIHLLHSSDDCRLGFYQLVKEGNERRWFSRKDADGNCKPDDVPNVQLLTDVKTQWDSVITQTVPKSLECALLGHRS